MSKKIYTKEEITQGLLDKQLIIMSEVKTTNDKVHCKTLEGYDVLALPSSILRRQDAPRPFAKYNPYTISNIKKWLENNHVDLELISDTYISSNAKLKWKCGNCDSIFEASWAAILGGKKYCNYCAHSKRFDGFRDYYEIVKTECKKYNYKLLSNKINRSTDVFEYICDKHKEYGSQRSTYDSMVRGGRHCLYCGIESRGIKSRLDESEIKKIVEEKGYIYCGVDYENYKSQNRKRVNILVKCRFHEDKGVQIMSLDNIRAGNGRCRYCCGKQKTKKELQKEIDVQKLDVTILEYIEYGKPILVKCNICGYEWYTHGVYLHSGTGCPNCSKSKFEKEVQEILDKHSFDYVSQYRFIDCKDKRPLPFDFYIEDKNILIEVDGEGHYKSIRREKLMTEDEAMEQLKIIQRHDAIKTQYCLDNGIKLIRIPYWERNNIENYILKRIET